MNPRKKAKKKMTSAPDALPQEPQTSKIRPDTNASPKASYCYNCRKNTKNDLSVPYCDRNPPGLADSIANRADPVDEIVFGQDFICITDIKVGPDGLLYVTSLVQNAIFRIVPNELAGGQPAQLTVLQIAIYAGMAIAAGVAVYGVRRLRKRSGSRNPQSS